MYSSNSQIIIRINKIEINDKTLQLPIPSVTENLRPSDKIRKDFPHYHILQKTSSL